MKTKPYRPDPNRPFYARHQLLAIKLRGTLAMNDLRRALYRNDAEAAKVAEAELDQVDKDFAALESEVFETTHAAGQRAISAFEQMVTALAHATRSFREFVQHLPARVRSRGRRKW